MRNNEKEARERYPSKQIRYKLYFQSNEETITEMNSPGAGAVAGTNNAQQLPRLLWHGRFRPESGGKEPAGTCWNRRKLCRNREELYRNRLRFQRIQSPE
ncbi:unnamed protein product [Adineta ricciae]|uniref:Uncharacterized protein n=1 Tax=Adineta ricciae TaxID=249248 RepID=A0A815LWH9_ADIRI|nr:unnamed protein product [Adineta ricciae]